MAWLGLCLFGTALNGGFAVLLLSYNGIFEAPFFCTDIPPKDMGQEEKFDLSFLIVLGPDSMSLQCRIGSQLSYVSFTINWKKSHSSVP